MRNEEKCIIGIGVQWESETGLLLMKLGSGPGRYGGCMGGCKSHITGVCVIGKYDLDNRY